MDRLAWGGGHWAHTSVSLLGGHGKVWQRGAQSCCLSGPQPAQDRALQRGCGWRFPWKASPERLRALRGRGGGDTHLKLAKVGGGGLARPREAPQAGRSRRGSVSARRDQVRRRPPGPVATFVLCRGSGTQGVIKSAQAGEGERSGGAVEGLAPTQQCRLP